jgi:uncharacterized protein YndB with AHSA1/START domain
MPNQLYKVEREYPVSIDLLWEAWVSPEALEAWYSPTDLKVVPGSVISVAQEGGLWTVGVDVSQFGFNAYFFGRYTAVEPKRKLTHTLHYTQSETEFLERDETTEFHVIEIDFEPRGDSAWVSFTQFGEMPAEEALQAKAGMESYFDNLGKYLLGAK